ncbi:MAG: DUF58 domain-containing protein [Planctomycetaceae bacterium]|nr:DUF58 domain-containing protein [Planctomycetaceae bacterium]
MAIKSLELRARTIVEDFCNGLHRSPYHGFSVEFTEYRQYSPGDDLRYLDWRLYARTDRYYVKRFEDETNLRCHLLVDTSRSMTFGSMGYTKADYAKTLAATLAYFLSTQRDAAGLVRFDERIDEFIPARCRTGHLRRIMVALEKPEQGQSTDLSQPLEQVAEQVTKRGMLVLISDLLADVSQLDTRLGYLRARGHEVVVFHTLDPAELELDFDQPALFEDAESGRQLYVDPVTAKKQYQRNLQDHVERVQASCEKHGITYHRLPTDTPMEEALLNFLQDRQHQAPRPVRRSGNQGGKVA